MVRTMIVKAINIVWDTSSDEDEGNPPTPESLGLPTECEIEVDTDDEEEMSNYMLVDALSDKYGFCIFSVGYEGEKG